MELQLWGPWVLLFLAGIAAGFANALAGGGSLLTLPLLMLLGLPASVANGTNRVAVVFQSFVGARGFARKADLEARAAFPLVVPTVVGAAAGAWAAARLPDVFLRPVLLGMAVVMALVLALRPRLVLPEDGEAPVEGPPSVGVWLGLLGAGFYGGFIQAGVGLVLLALLGGMLRYDVIHANAIKLLCTLVFSAVALVIFASLDKVRWGYGFVLAAGSVAGVTLGVRAADRVDRRLFRRILLVATLATACGAAFRG